MKRAWLLALFVLTAFASRSAIADELIGTYDINYRYNAAGYAPNGGPNDGNPYYNVTPPGPYYVDAAPGTYRVVVKGYGAAGPSVAFIWDGDASGGTLLHTPVPGNIGDSTTIDHASGQIVFYYWDWYAGDNSTDISVQVELWRVSDPTLYVGHYISGGGVDAYDPAGTLLRQFGQGTVPYGQALGPDRILYELVTSTAHLERYDSLTGGDLGSLGDTPGGNFAVFGPDKLLYVNNAGYIFRIDPTTGSTQRLFQAAWDAAGIAFRPDNGNLLVSRVWSGVIEEYSLAADQLLGTFAVDSGNPFGIAFGPDNRLYIAEYNSTSAVNVVPTEGGVATPFAQGPLAGQLGNIDFDDSNHLYATDYGNGLVLRFDGTTGAFQFSFTAGANALGLSVEQTILRTIVVSPSSVNGGQNAVGTLTINRPAPSGGAIIHLSTTVPGTTVPSTVTIPEGDAAVSFSVGTSATMSPKAGIVTASYRGRSLTATLTVTPAQPDPLTINITSPTSTTYLLNQPVAASYGCSGGAGTVTCIGPVPSGSNIDTMTVGSKTFTVTASDSEGQSKSQSVTYSVGFAISVLYDQSKAHKSGSTVPIKLQLTDAAGTNVSSASISVHAVSTTQLSGTPTGLLDDSGAANPDYDFRYDSSLGGYLFNLSLKGYAPGVYALHFRAGSDPTDHTVQFQVR